MLLEDILNSLEIKIEASETKWLFSG